MLREVSCSSKKKVDVRAEHIDEGIVVGREQVLATPSTSRPLKRTYAVAGQ